MTKSVNWAKIIIPKYLKDNTISTGHAGNIKGASNWSRGNSADLDQLMVSPENLPNSDIRDIVVLIEVSVSPKSRSISSA